jgi:hypothetical protein
LAVTDALPFSVNLQVRSFSPPLEQAPDQTASRPSEMLSVIDVPVGNVADPVPPTFTLIPAGFDDTRSPLRPVAVTVNVAPCAGGFTVSVAVRVTPLCAAVMVTGVDPLTVVVDAVNVLLAAPAGTVTLAGTEAPAALLDSDTRMPPDGAALDNVTVPVEFAPPVTLAGFMLSPWRLAGGGTGVTVRDAVLDAPPYDPVSVTGVLAATEEVAIANVPLVAPAAIVTLAGTVAALVLLLDSVTTAPPLGAADVSVAVPVDPFPPTTVDGLEDSADNAGAAGAARGVNRRLDENEPNTPAALRARTRHHRRRAGRPLSVTRDSVAVWLTTNGAAMVDELSTCTS